MKKIILFVVIHSFVNYTFGQSDLVKELNKRLIKIETISPESDFQDLSSLQQITANKSIIGLGEATHGTHEFFVYKHRLIRYLVEEQDFKLFIIEGDFAGSQIMNNYISNGKESINNALFGVGMGEWMTQEFVEFVEWLKKYNAAKPLEDQIKFYGCDMQSPVSAANKIQDYLANLNLLDSSVENGLNWFIERKYRSEQTMNSQDIVKQLFDDLANVFNEVENKSNKDLNFVKHCQRELEQFFEWTYANRTTQLVLRDKFMAENIKWIYNFENQQKAVFWAHNEHIKNSDSGLYQKPVGYYLKNDFQNKYYTFGFGFCEGDVRGYMGYSSSIQKWDVYSVPKVRKKSTDAVFAQCSEPVFILDFNKAGTNRLINDFLYKDLYHRAVSAGYLPKNKKNNHYRKSKLIETFDGVIFFRNTTPSAEIQ